ISDSKSLEYTMMLQSAGPMAIVGHLRTAVLTGNKALGAAALRRLDAFDKDWRDKVFAQDIEIPGAGQQKISRLGIATALVGQEHQTLLQAWGSSRGSCQRRSWATGPHSASPSCVCLRDRVAWQ